MTTLKRGSKGREVESLQNFLNNFVDPDILTDGSFGEGTENAVRVAQSEALKRGLKIGSAKPDGVVGPMTAGAFLQMGWQRFEPSKIDPNFAKPGHYTALTSVEKVFRFGSPGAPAEPPVPGGPIVANASFKSRLVTVDMRDYMTLPAGFQSVLTLNSLVKGQWIALFKDIEAAGHSGDLISCGGSYLPRYVRGSTKTFSSHAFATAIDLNAPQNWLGATPAREGEPGYLGNIVALGKKYYLYSGFWFARLDGMHIESTLTDDELRKIGAL
jgi:hypothetical protein